MIGQCSQCQCCDHLFISKVKLKQVLNRKIASLSTGPSLGVGNSRRGSLAAQPLPCKFRLTPAPA